MPRPPKSDTNDVLPHLVHTLTTSHLWRRMCSREAEAIASTPRRAVPLTATLMANPVAGANVYLLNFTGSGKPSVSLFG